MVRMAECGFDEPHEPHEYVIAGPDGRPLDRPCPGLILEAIEAVVDATNGLILAFRRWHLDRHGYAPTEHDFRLILDMADEYALADNHDDGSLLGSTTSRKGGPKPSGDASAGLRLRDVSAAVTPDRPAPLHGITDPNAPVGWQCGDPGCPDHGIPDPMQPMYDEQDAAAIEEDRRFEQYRDDEIAARHTGEA
jgi:hypothetical protein